MIRTVTSVFLLLIFCVSEAQDKGPLIKFRNLSIEDGLSMSTVMDICQTKDGYIWFATPDGLNRYDGYDFKILKSNPNAPSISDNYITRLLSLPDGSLLIGSNSGTIDRYYPDKMVFEKIDISHLLKDVNFPISRMVLSDNETVMISAYDAGLVKFNINTGTLKLIEPKNRNNKVMGITSICKINDGEFAVGTFGGVLFFNAENETFSAETYLSEMSVLDIVHFKGKVYLCTENNGLYTLDIKSKKVSNVKISDDEDLFSNLTFAFVDKTENIWIGSIFDGVLKIKPNGEKIILTHGQTEKFSLINNTAYSVMEDKSGNLWFGTISGVSCYIPINQQFAHYRPKANNPNTISNQQVYYVYEDRFKNIWVGTLEGGLNRFIPEKEIFEAFHRNNSKGLYSNSVRSIYQDTKFRYWIGTDNGLYQFLPQEKKFKQVTFKGKSIIESAIKSIFETPTQTLLIGTQTGGIIHFNPDNINEQPEIFYPNSENNQPLQIYEIKQGRAAHLLWVATFGGGLYEFDLNKKAFINQYNSAQKESINNNNLMSMHALGKDTLLIGTFGGGLNILDLKTNKVSYLTENEGLPNNAIYGILIDEEKNWWVSTNKGIAKFNPETGRVRKFDQIEQVQSLEFNEGAYCKGSDGRFYFGGINGLNIFFPEKIKDDHNKPLVWITSFKVSDKEYIPLTDAQLTLNHNQRFIDIEFIGIDFVLPGKINYSYMLEGLDDDWVENSDRRYARYSALRPGEYNFKVRAVKPDGEWAESTQSIAFIITPPFWLTWWFISIGLIVSTLMLLFVYKYRTRNIRKEFQLKMYDVELKALRSQMNPHFIFNSINSIQYYILNKSPQQAYSYLAKFSNLMRRILQNSKINYITLEEEMESLNLYLELESIRMEGELFYNIEVDSDINQTSTYIPSMLIQPYVENAILHGLLNKEGEKKINIRVRKEISHLYCEIEDNGIGRLKAKEYNKNRTNKHESTAMKTTKDRLEILNRKSSGKLNINIVDKHDLEGNPTGTKVQVFIPYFKENIDK
jgi:ligand-binding sensor domain-containing protein